jgi:hypothetical protein
MYFFAHSFYTFGQFNFRNKIDVTSQGFFLKSFSKCPIFKGVFLCQVSNKILIWPKSIFFLNSIFNSKKKSHIRFFVKWQTNFLEQFSVFWPFLWPVFGWIYIIICKKYKSYYKTGISFDFWHFQSGRIQIQIQIQIKNRFDHLFEHNLNLYFSI